MARLFTTRNAGIAVSQASPVDVDEMTSQEAVAMLREYVEDIDPALEGHSGPALGVAVTADGKRAISASEDKTLKVWDLAAGLPIVTFHCDAAVQCCVFADDLTIIAGDYDGNLHFLRLEE